MLRVLRLHELPRRLKLLLHLPYKPPWIRSRLCICVLSVKPSIRLPMHPFRLVGKRFEQICSSAQAPADRPCSVHGSQIGWKSLARICQLVAMTTRKDAFAIKHRDSASTINRRATEPCTAPTVVARNPFEQHRIAIPQTLADQWRHSNGRMPTQLDPGPSVGCHVDGCDISCLIRVHS